MKQRITNLFALAIALLASSGAIAQNTASVPPGDAKAGKVEAIKDEMSEALTVIEQNYGAKVNHEQVVKSSIDSMLNTLDPHSNYYDPKETEAFQNEQQSQYFGIGAVIGDLSDPSGNIVATYIKATFSGAPAHRAGLRYGDKIVEVNGVSMLGKPLGDVRNVLRGAEGTTAKVVVERLGSGVREMFEITRGAVSQPTISEAYMIRPGIGYIALRGGFHRTTLREFSDAMRRLKTEGMQEIIIDLRDNGGGLVNAAGVIAEAFLDQGQTVYTQKGRTRGVNSRHTVRYRSPDRSPIVVLVNRHSASASEILAGALQDHDRALIVGENTFGKGLVQGQIPLDNGGLLLLVIAKYETPSGRLIQRDYSNGDLYSYQTGGGSLRGENPDAVRPRGEESKTDTGRSVYSGAGIDPDVVVKPKTISIERSRVQQRLVSPVFAFALDAVLGKIKGLDAYRISNGIAFNYDLKATDFPITDEVYAAFKQYASSKYKVSGAVVDREREFVTRILRTEFVTAAYGSQTSFQVFNEYDDQLLKAIELLPQAKQLALQAERVRTGLPPKAASAN